VPSNLAAELPATPAQFPIATRSQNWAHSQSSNTVSPLAVNSRLGGWGCAVESNGYNGRNGGGGFSGGPCPRPCVHAAHAGPVGVWREEATLLGRTSEARPPWQAPGERCM
jgi:hypothetical protein